jgi:hypothetical protein
MTEKATERANRIGRRLGNVLFALLIGTFTLVCSAQVLSQGFSAAAGPFESIDCQSGLKSLARALHRAREATTTTGQNERARLERFRTSLLPEWQSRDVVQRQCASDTWGKQAYFQIERLRWAEEQAVRYESVDLARSRQTVIAIEKALADTTNFSH